MIWRARSLHIEVPAGAGPFSAAPGPNHAGRRVRHPIACRNPTRYLALIENRLTLNVSDRPPVEQISKP
jgi:hypothetical protein